MNEGPMALIRKLDDAATALLKLARQVTEVAPEMEDAVLRQERERRAWSGAQRRWRRRSASCV